jgi:thymidylate synthase
MKAYHDILRQIIDEGTVSGNRTDTSAIKTTGAMFKHNMQDGFPLLTTKKINPRVVFAELEFFIKGYSDKAWLKERKCNIWNEWCNPLKVPYAHDDETKAKMADENDLGRIYGVQWRNWGGSVTKSMEQMISHDTWNYRFTDIPGIDQLKNCIDTLKNDPNSRRNIVLAWNPAELAQMALPPCHFGFQITSNGEYVDLTWFQRSVDTFLGLPFNIASYGLLLELIAKTVGMKARFLVGQLVDVHIYENHLTQVNEQLSRDSKKLPTLVLPDDVNIFDWEYTQHEILNYEPHPFIKAPIAV